ncbi:hypothetical protein CEXT_443761 [Caerostris extrusa]|uniref:Uncharacterized protein n=1 Tax=Caerostris extrusa TaxID=172846 RepID=A0AAV4XWE6_CAEEX|nr:hypothetical protein CEXT_443761 [Caerostris extrusa]
MNGVCDPVTALALGMQAPGSAAEMYLRSDSRIATVGPLLTAIKYARKYKDSENVELRPDPYWQMCEPQMGGSC